MDYSLFIVFVVSGIAGVVAAVLSFTKLGHSWVVAVCVLPASYSGMIFFWLLQMEGFGHWQYGLGGACLIVLSVFNFARWFKNNKKETTLTKCLAVVVLLYLVYNSHFLAMAYHQDSQQVRCILNMDIIEKLIPSYSGMNNLQPGEQIEVGALVDKGYLPELYTCPAGGEYSYTGRVPTGKKGTPAFTSCSHLGHVFEPYE